MGTQPFGLFPGAPVVEVAEAGRQQSPATRRVPLAACKVLRRALDKFPLQHPFPFSETKVAATFRGRAVAPA